MHDGDDIMTIEGFGSAEALTPLQAAFVTHDGFQCGYCTPGQIVSANGMLAEARAGWPSNVSHTLEGPVELSDDEISERMSGNLCRCAAYTGINAAIREAAGATGGTEDDG
jgi:xanthine dehydrogenase YagT iron-sulfur-binding subunit